MTRACVVLIAGVLGACGGGDGPVDVDARCALGGETYDAFGAGDGARCGEGEGAGYCFAGDRCESDGVCELVSTPTGDGYCALLDRPYTAYSSATGARCGSGEGAGYCIPGDRCREEGICEAVLSAARGQPHAALLGQRYDAFASGDGARCGTGEGAGYCFGGDECVAEGACEVVLTGLGGTVRADLVGSEYDAYEAGDGVRCGDGEGAGYCRAGDRCTAPAVCEVVLSAWTP
jgi:hypothetical protein